MVWCWLCWCVVLVLVWAALRIAMAEAAMVPVCQVLPAKGCWCVAQLWARVAGVKLAWAAMECDL